MLFPSHDLNGGSIGTSSSAGAVSGEASGIKTDFEQWDGTSWTETTEVNAGRQQGAGAGTNAAGLFFGGYSPPGIKAANESWNGSSWTEVGDLNDGRYIQGGGGTSTAAICCGGDTPGATGNTETWNGSAWTEVSNLNTARKSLTEGAGLYDDFLTIRS